VGLGHQLNPDGDLENYRYPGHFETPDQAKKYTKIHLEADCVDLITGEGQTRCMRLLPGKLLTIKQHFTSAFNRPYLLTKVIHEGLQPQSLEEGSSNRGIEYQSTFYTMPNETAFRVQVIQNRKPMTTKPHWCVALVAKRSTPTATAASKCNFTGTVKARWMIKAASGFG